MFVKLGVLYLSWWDEWRRRFSPFRDIEEFIGEFEREVERMFREFTRDFEAFLKERKPLVWGFSVELGPGFKPKIRQFGNIKMGLKPEVTVEREPLVDTFTENDTVKVVAELPGVEKQDIKLNTTEETLTISVDTPQRKYYKEVDLPEKVNPKTAKATYKNGVLEITFKRKEWKPKGEPIKID